MLPGHQGQARCSGRIVEPGGEQLTQAGERVGNGGRCRTASCCLLESAVWSRCGGSDGANRTASRPSAADAAAITSAPNMAIAGSSWARRTDSMLSNAS